MGYERSAQEVVELPDGEVVQTRTRVLRADGSYRVLSRCSTPFRRDADGKVVQSLTIARDITNEVQAEAQLQHAAMHDPLTGLPNRRLVADRLRTALHGTARGGRLAVLFLDLDWFKRVNDAHGHAAGDVVLTVTAERLLRAVRPYDTVGRMGGDEFVVILCPAEDEDVVTLATQVGDRLRDELRVPVEHDGLQHSVTASIGLAYADSSDDADIVLRDADTAMYRAKTDGKDRLAVFDPEHHGVAVARAGVERTVREALGNDTLEAFFQPIIRLGTGRLAGVEALLRVRGCDGCYLDTEQAILVAEQTGMIAEIGVRMLRTACAQTATWTDGLTVSVNLSAREVALPRLHERVQDVLHQTGLSPDRLVLELTESVLLEAAHSTVRDLHQLRASGVGIAIDDFGTGYASLRYLATLPVTCVKVDRSFTAGLGVDPICETLVRATIGLARDLGLSCVVEGVETEAQLDLLGSEPHVLAQGYLLGRPRPAGECPGDLLARR
jgi:diguanylate cyclase (GGDEF)-like protein